MRDYAILFFIPFVVITSLAVLERAALRRGLPVHCFSCSPVSCTSRLPSHPHRHFCGTDLSIPLSRLHPQCLKPVIGPMPARLSSRQLQSQLYGPLIRFSCVFSCFEDTLKVWIGRWGVLGADVVA